MNTFLLQLKYKRRVYKMLHMDEKQLKNVNTKASRKKFLEAVANGNVDKVTKMCAKGLDPNFHCQDSGGECHGVQIWVLLLSYVLVELFLPSATFLAVIKIDFFNGLINTQKHS